MDRNVRESVTVVTGASSGIGRATALNLAEQGGAVVLAARNAGALRDLVGECEARGGRALAVPTDVAVEEQVRTLFQEALDEFGRIDAWVNNAAVSLLGRFEDCPAEDFRRVVETNFFGYVHGVRAVLPYFKERRRGILVNVASVVSRVSNPFATAYAASKAAILSLSEGLRMELLDIPDIHVCSVLPSTIDTPLFQHAGNVFGREARAMPPVYPPERVAEAIVSVIRYPRREVKVGSAGSMIALRSLLPAAVSERLLAYMVKREHFQDRPAPAKAGNLYQPAPPFNAVHGGWRPHRNGNDRVMETPSEVASLAAGVGVLCYWMARHAFSQGDGRPERP